LSRQGWSVALARNLKVFDSGFLEDRHGLADALNPSFIILVEPIGDHSAQSRLCDRDGAVDTRTERGIDRAPDRCHAVSGTLNDRVEFGVNDEIVFHRSLKPLGRVFDASRQSVETRRDDLMILADDDRTDTSARVLAP